MTAPDILAFINENPLSFIATTQNGAPRVRGIMTCWADADGIVFNTGTMKDFHRQLTADPAVELCYYSPEKNIQVRVSGTAEPDTDRAVMDRVLEKLPFLKPWVAEKGYGIMSPWRVRNGSALVWTFDANFAPKAPIAL